MTRTAGRRRADRVAQPIKTRAELIEAHRAARARRDTAELDSDAYRAAAEEIARIEIAINQIGEPPASRAG